VIRTSQGGGGPVPSSPSGDGFGPGTPSLLRALNERSILRVIGDTGPVSRAQLARTMGLSKPTVSEALARLEGAGLVREVGLSTGGRGRGAVLYELHPRAGWVVGVDVGRGWVRAAIADITGTFAARRDERARVRSARTLIEQIGAVAHELAAEAGLRWRDVTQAVIGSPGVFEPTRGQVALAPNLPGWGREGLVEAVRAVLGTDVAFENDVNLAALGEQWRGLGKGVNDFVFLSVGTGIGLGLVVRGELYRGANGFAGEVGYLPIGDGRRTESADRRHGAFEAAAGASGVVRTARDLGVPPPLTAKKVFALARRGDRPALRAVRTEANRLALAVATIVPVVDPELVILGGGIGRNGDLLLEPVRAGLERLSPFRPRVEVSALGDDAVLHGAVATALGAAQDRLFFRRHTKKEGTG
jgi:predicted NBD/HSP70 family sugar kinase